MNGSRTTIRYPANGSQALDRALAPEAAEGEKNQVKRSRTELKHQRDRDLITEDKE